MSDMRNRLQENYGWTAYMKLKGQTCARTDDEILDEFQAFVQSLRSANVNYNVIVMVEGKVPRQLRPERATRQSEAEVTREGSGA